MIQLTQGNFDCTQPIGEDGTPTPGGELCPTGITLEAISVKSAEEPTTTILFVTLVFASLAMTLAKRRKMI